MRVGPIGQEWWVKCTPIGTDRQSWDAQGATPVVRVGNADESCSRYYSFVLMSRHSGAGVLEIRAASTVGGIEPFCFADSGRLFVVTDGWVSEIDASAGIVAWEHLADTPVMDVWLLEGGQLLVVSETDVVSLDTQGRTVWNQAFTAVVAGYRHDSPFLHITDGDGGVVALDEKTGARSRA